MLKYLLIVCVVCWLTGCAIAPVAPEKITIPATVDMTIVTTAGQMPCPADGCFTETPWQQFKIYIRAEKRRGKFWVDPWTLGHEMQHLLNHVDPDLFPNPDRE